MRKLILKKSKEEQSEVTVKKQNNKIHSILTDINKKLQGEGKISIGSEIRCLDADRISTGSVSVDYILNGGLPRGMFVQFKGLESSSKTTTCLKASREVQNTRGNVAWLSSEGFNKSWARKNGVWIPYDHSELKMIESQEGREGLAKLKEYNKECSKKGEFVLAMTKTGDKLLDVAVELLSTNEFDLLIIDSLTQLANSKELEGEMGDDSYGGNAKMLNKFCRILTSRFNELDSTETGCRTAVVGIQQLRDQIGSYAMAPDATGGRGLKHTKVADVLFKRIDHLVYGDKEKRIVYGRQISATTTKCKIGPEGRVGQFDLYVTDFNGIKAGTIDTANEVLLLGIKFGLFSKSAAWIKIDGEQFQGVDAATSYLRSNPELVETCRKEILSISKS